MPLPTEPTHWTVTLTPAEPPAAAAPSLRARARRWALTAVALFAAYLIGTAQADGSTAAPPAPAYTAPTTVTVEPQR
ncbi:hypothetical protein GCM10010218_65480 [Streptomyces mashuensis]|uniref:Uncharacterized protein n=1 Tax=Streptomyces mashuensis TaxID=33904 RepID=A0A919EGG8_9ACTN|nr:hypothetical protein [Streptomyces mashuensis]GHF75451.1 hypothetical protein GCM10010218_65480 [Streptomyces mashuensis]